MNVFADLPGVEWVHGYWYCRSALNELWCRSAYVDVARPGAIDAACERARSVLRDRLGAPPVDLDWEVFEYPHKPPAADLGNPRGFTKFGSA